MSKQRQAFEVAAAQKKWADAFSNLNSLSMQEMLEALVGLSPAIRKDLIAHRFAFRLGHNMPRMEYAWTALATKKLPLVAPGDMLATHQVDTVARFIKNAPPNPTRGRFKLKISVFTDSIVKNRTLFGELRDKANEILATQGNAFELAVDENLTDINYNEVMYLGTQVEEMANLAKSQFLVPQDRLIVLNVRVMQNVHIHGVAYKTPNGQSIVALDTDTPNPDRATLLHEIGHSAGLPHAGETPAGKPTPVDVGAEDNVMSVPSGWIRKFLTVTQGEALAKAYFTAAP